MSRFDETILLPTIKTKYKTRLNASVDYVRFLLRQGLPFRGHDEREGSSNRGNFLELLHFYAQRNEKVGSVVLHNALGNQHMIAPLVQKDIMHAIAKETTKAIIEDLRDDFFGILVDECRDVSCKEQMALVLRYVDRRGFVMERFIGIAHVTDTSATSLKVALHSMLSTHGLSLSRIWAQGYDGVSNMKGEFNGLKALVMKETTSTYYIHCFAHQLQLTLVFVAKNHFANNDFFDLIARLMNMIRASCKHQDKLREKQVKNIVEALLNGKLQSGRGLNQEMGIKKAGDTRWGSHNGSLLNVMTMFDSIIEELEDIESDGICQDQRVEARRLLDLLESFDFIFCMHLMLTILGITNELNLALQKKDQNIVNDISLVKVAKQRLQQTRDDGWKDLFDDVSSFCNKHNIQIPKIEDAYARRKRCKAS